MLKSLPRSQFFQKFNLKYENISFVAFHNLSMATLTPQDVARLKARMHNLKPMNMKLFEKQLTLIDEDYPFTIPTWLELILQIGTGATLLAAVGALLWFCIKHKSHLLALWRFTTSVSAKLKENPNMFPHLLAQGMEFIWHQCPLSPPPQPSTSCSDQRTSLTAASGLHSKKASKTREPHPPARPLVPTTPHHNTLEFITQAAQELYSHGKLRVKPYSEHLCKEMKQPHHIEDKV